MQRGPAACYICQLASTPGKFLPEKAVKLGVPKGPLFGQLKAGNAVQLSNGRTVQPEEVLSLSFVLTPRTKDALLVLRASTDHCQNQPRKYV